MNGAVFRRADLVGVRELEFFMCASDRADESRYVVKRLSGAVIIDGRPDVEPGDEIIIPPEVDFKAFQFLKDVIDIVFKVSVAALLFL